MSNTMTLNDIKSSLPFFRFLYQKENKESEIERLVAGRNVYPEVVFIISILLSLHYWPNHLDSTYGVLALVLWILILVDLFTLAVVNAKTMLLPNLLLKPLVAIVAVYQIVLAVQLKEAGVVTTAIYGGVLTGFILYLLFQVTKGRWIGGGDVRVGAIAGLILGWKYGLLCLALMVGLVGLSFLVEYLTSKLTNGSHKETLPTGILWPIAIIASAILSWGVH